MNGKLSTISRVVVHPKYRTIGLGAKLVKETLNLAGTEHVEMSAVMAKYNPFAEKAAMKKVAEQQPPKEATRIAETLQALGFDLQLLSSKNYIQNKLQTLNPDDIAKIREAFIKQRHARFIKSFSYHLPFGTKQAYVQAITNANPDKLANLIKICGYLMQTKVYLFRKKEGT